MSDGARLAYERERRRLHLDSAGSAAESRRWCEWAALCGIHVFVAYALSMPDVDLWSARLLTGALALGYLAFLTLVVPAAVAGAISRERADGSLSEVLLTGLQPRDLVLAKYLAAARAPGILWVALLPACAASFIASHYPWERFFQVQLVLVAAGALVPAVTLLASAFARPYGAFVLAYALVIVWFWVPLLFGPHVRGEALVWYATPVFPTLMLLFANSEVGPLARPLAPEWVWFIVLAAGMTLVSLRVAAWKLQRDRGVP